MLKSAVIILSLTSLLLAGDYDVISDWLIYSDVENSLYHLYADAAFQALDKRQSEIAKLQSVDDWQQRQQHVRNILNKIVGPFPKKTPLSAQITGRLHADDFLVEKVLFQSQPEFYVTACLFLPKQRQPKAPTIIYCSGHTEEGFRSSTYQRVILNLVKKGFIVFAFDPVGQGERLQYFDPETDESTIGGPTKEHSYPGAQCFLIGSSLAKYMIWDGIRAVDYLLTRPEVDPSRIGITGRSGGGTQSTYIAAFDERIYASAPECYITSFRRLIESIGPQDAEQNIYQGLAHGIDLADFLQVRAPKPTFIISTTRDFFSIQGMQETFLETRLAYEMFGKTSNLHYTTDDSTHASTQNNRQALYNFFLNTFQLGGDPIEIDVQPFPPEQLFVTDSGQVSLSLTGETVFSLNKKHAEIKLATLKDCRAQATFLENLTSHLKKSIVDTLDADIGTVFAGGFKKQDFRIEKWFIKNPQWVLPFLVVRPVDDLEHPALLYIHPDGKESAMQETWIKKSVQRGNVIILPDLIGAGECGPGEFQGDAYNFRIGRGAYNIWFFGLQLGTNLVYTRSNQLLALLDYLQTRYDINSKNISIIGHGLACPIAQHTAAITPSLKRVALIEPLLSYESLVLNEYYKPEFMHATVPGALQRYDLVDLNKCIAPRELAIFNPLDHTGRIASEAQVQNFKTALSRHYDGLKSVDKLKFFVNFQPQKVDSALAFY